MADSKAIGTQIQTDNTLSRFETPLSCVRGPREELETPVSSELVGWFGTSCRNAFISGIGVDTRRTKGTASATTVTRPIVEQRRRDGESESAFAARKGEALDAATCPRVFGSAAPSSRMITPK